MNASAHTERKGMGCVAGLACGLALLTAAIVLFILGADEGAHDALLAGSLLCLFLAAGLPLWIVVRQGGEDARAMDAVSAKGPRVEATILEVRLSARAPISYRVFARGSNPLTGEEVYFVGPMMRRDPRAHLGDRKTVTVVVDPAEPTRGVMDFSFLPGNRPIGWTFCGAELPASFA